MEVQWIKIMVNIFDNRKIKMIESLPEGESLVNMWFRLLVLAGNVNDNGLIYVSKEIPYTPETLATYWGKPLQNVKLALSTFEKLGMIEIIDNFLYLPSWEEYQSNEEMAKMREQGRVRQARFRERQREKLLANNVTNNVTDNVTVTLRNAIEEDKEIDKDKEYIESKDVKPKRKRFVPPTLDEVNQYAKEKGYTNFNAEKYISYYESVGWKVGRSGKPMKSWKASISNWVQNDKEYNKPKIVNPKNTVVNNFEQRQDDLDAMLKNGLFKRS